MAAPTIQVLMAFPATILTGNNFTLDDAVKGVLGNTTYKLAGTASSVDVSQWLTGTMSVSRGRSRETDRINASTLSFTLRNEDRRFDPTNALSPYAPGILPRTPVTVKVAGETIFTGYVEDYNVKYEKPNFCTVSVTCMDGFSILANTRLHAYSAPAQSNLDRARAILGQAGVVYSGGIYAPGQSAYVWLQANTFDDTAALDLLQTAIESEGGWFFIDRNGQIFWVDRGYLRRQIAPYAWTQGEIVFTDNYTGGVANTQNRLSAAAASFEDGSTGGVTAADWSPTSFNCNVSNTTAQHADGTHSLALTSINAGGMYAAWPRVSVLPGQVYSFLASVRAAATPQSCYLAVEWFDSTGANLSADSGGLVTDSASAWTASSFSATAPANAAYAQLLVLAVTTSAANEVHYADKLAVIPGTTSTWQAGGWGYAYTDISLTSAVTLLFNHVEGTRTNGGVLQVADDYGSQAIYQIRTLALTALENFSDGDVLNLVAYKLAFYSTPTPRFDTLQVELAALSADDQAVMAAIDLLTLATAVRNPPGGGAAISQLSAVEKMDWAFDVGAGTYKLALGLMSLANLP